MELIMKLLKDAQTRFDALNDNVDDWRNRDAFESNLGSLSKLTRAYTTKCTGDVCKGDQVAFVQRHWERKAINRYGKLANVVVGYSIVSGVVEKESYGAEKQQHTFSIRCDDKELLLIKGRNLYAIGVWRKPWANEEQRHAALEEKHQRGGYARQLAANRRRDMGLY